MTWLVIQTVLQVSGYLVPYRTLACIGLPLPPPFRSILSCASISASRLVFCILFFFFFFLFSSGLSTAAKVHQQQACLSGQPHISLSHLIPSSLPFNNHIDFYSLFYCPPNRQWTRIKYKRDSDQSDCRICTIVRAQRRVCMEYSDSLIRDKFI